MVGCRRYRDRRCRNNLETWIVPFICVDVCHGRLEVVEVMIEIPVTYGFWVFAVCGDAGGPISEDDSIEDSDDGRYGLDQEYAG
jgi:hypothetical protein